MPNHIQNRLKVIGTQEQINEVLESIKSINEDGSISEMDFNKIKPMPKQLNIDDSSTGSLVQFLLFGTGDGGKYSTIAEAQNTFSKWNDKMKLEGIELALQYQKNFVEFGAITWYKWAIENWGTKWNAYGKNDERNTIDTIYFQTAWSAPIDLIETLSKKFPDTKIEFTYADEDSGSNTGKGILQNGNWIEEIQPESQSIEGYDIYFELNPESKEDYQLIDGKYEYVDDED